MTDASLLIMGGRGPQTIDSSYDMAGESDKAVLTDGLLPQPVVDGKADMAVNKIPVWNILRPNLVNIIYLYIVIIWFEFHGRQVYVMGTIFH